MMKMGETEMVKDDGQRLGVVAIVVKDRDQSYSFINDILHDHGKIVVGRIGIPYRERNISVIALIVDGTTDEIGALTGKLGQVKNVIVKSMVTQL
jgi:putative iron-only hydrogenase system regulator